MKLSVILPVYNAQDYLAEAIKSILKQTFTKFELIIIDDGSTDKSLSIIQQFTDPRIKLIKHQENRGLVTTLNEGIKKSKGEYIARMDADDISLPNRFAKQIKFLDKHSEVSICGTWIQNFGNKNYTWKTPTKHQLIKTRMLFESSLAHPTVMMKKKFFNHHQLKYENKYLHAEDYALWVKAAQKTQLANYPQILLKYRTHDKQTPKQISNSQQESSWKIREYQLQKIKIKPNSQEKKIHQGLSSWNKDFTFDEFSQIGDWLRKILKHNQLHPYFADQELSRVIGQRWLGIVRIHAPKNFLVLGSLIIHADLTLLGIYSLLSKK